MNRLFVFLLLSVCWSRADAFVRGADVSWCTEMEADGCVFYDSEGGPADVFALMKDAGMEAVRLRVWVDPEAAGYGTCCGKADVVAKARRAASCGLDVMIDFHYSDFFVDPGTQTTPSGWSGLSLDGLKAAVGSYTADVLQTLKDEGIEPKWVQVGNETNNGMLWPAGKIDWELEGLARYAGYVALHNAGYDAVKRVFPAAQVIMHIADAYNAGDWEGWFFKDMKAAGARFDIIGLSHYPNYENWGSLEPGAVSNANAAGSVETLASLFDVPVMICETGYSVNSPERAEAAMRDLLERMSAIDGCTGVFYWEPETDGVWKPNYYDRLGWDAYAMGAFSDGRPTAALAPFKGSEGSVALTTAGDGATEFYDLTGRKIDCPDRGFYIQRSGGTVRKVWR